MRIFNKDGLICAFAVLLLSGCPNVREEAELMSSRCDGTATPFASGSGTTSDPYLICSSAQLKNVTNYLSSSFKLGKSISLQGVSFSPIGSNDTTGFSGTFDGAGYTISNWTYSNASDPYAIGFVRKLSSGGVIKNLTLSSSVLTGNDMVAGFAGFSAGTITSVTLKNSTLVGQSTVAGIVGEVTGVSTVASSSVISSTITSSASGARMNPADFNNNAAAGAVGILSANSVVSQVTVSLVTISFKKDSLLHLPLYSVSGGVVGLADVGTIVQQSNFSGTLEGYYDVGGIVGYSAGSVIDSTANGLVQGNTVVGGVVGLSTGSVERSSFIGTVFGDDIDIGAGGGNPNQGRVGGVVGVLAGTLNESFFSGSVIADKTVGGVVGLFSLGSIRDCYAEGTLLGVEDPVAGGFGSIELSDVERVYVSMTSIGGGANPQAVIGSKAGGVPLPSGNAVFFLNIGLGFTLGGNSIATAADMQVLANFTGFAASGKWSMPTVYPGRVVLSPILAWECGKNGISCAP